MKKINIIKTAAVSMACAVSLTSCSDWLDVKMEDKVMENVLYSNYEGFLTALNGVYLSMNDYYSEDLCAGTIEILAQQYNVSELNNHINKDLVKYNYTDASFESKNSLMWSRAYTLIANTNMVIEHTERANPLTPQQLGMIRGEALALRALLHFDLLRRHGSIYSEAPDAVAIPYQSSTSREIQPLLTNKQVMEKVFADLNEASELLRQYDPIIEKGVGDVNTVDDGVSIYDDKFRQLRLNYYAVQALLARAYMWVGDKTNAYRVAKNEIIDKITTEKLKVFPWVNKDVFDRDGWQDLIFSSEVMYALYNTKLTSNIYQKYFSYSISIRNRLTYFGTNMDGDSKIARLFPDPNDYRRKCWEVAEPVASDMQGDDDGGGSDQTTLALRKFAPFAAGISPTEVVTYRYMIPMIRLSEVYLIAAEATSDKKEALELINTIREHREAFAYPEGTDIDEALTCEMAGETVGEGQLFYFYKRRGTEKLISGTNATGYFDMVKTAYVWPIPQSELDKRVIVNDK